jgi:hypothetical protein
MKSIKNVSLMTKGGELLKRSLMEQGYKLTKFNYGYNQEGNLVSLSVELSK